MSQGSAKERYRQFFGEKLKPYFPQETHGTRCMHYDATLNVNKRGAGCGSGLSTGAKGKVSIDIEKLKPYLSQAGLELLAESGKKSVLITRVWLYICAGDSALTASHLCHDQTCVRPHHIVFESLGYNQWRNYCAGRLVCCMHLPQCLVEGGEHATVMTEHRTKCHDPSEGTIPRQPETQTPEIQTLESRKRSRERSHLDTPHAN